MAVWHEDNNPLSGMRMRKGVFGAHISMAPDGSGRAKIIFYKYKGDATKIGLANWRPAPDNSLLLSVKRETVGRSGARELAHEVLLSLERGEIEYEESAYPAPMKPTYLEEIDHPEAIAKAAIILWPDGKYESAYLALAPEGNYLTAVESPDGTEPGYAWGRPRTDRKTYATSYDEIREVAMQELSEIVGENPNIKRR